MPSCCYSNNNLNCLKATSMFMVPTKPAHCTPNVRRPQKGKRGENRVAWEGTKWRRVRGEMRREVGRYSRSWRVSSLPAAHHSVAQSDRHTDKREWRQTLAVSVRASPSSSLPPSSNCRSSPLVLGLLSLSLYRNHTHLAVTLSRLNTSFHSHNPQVLLKRTLSFTSARV